MTHRRSFPSVVRTGLLLTVALSLAVPALAEWKEKVLYSFQGLSDGSTPVGGVIFDPAGNMYGATQDGGSTSCQSIYECGTVYQLAPPGKQGDPWTETVLYVFQGNTKNDGASPFGGLVMDSSGNLYGTTAYGGTGDCVLLGSKLGCGAVFELSPPAQKGSAWTEKILYSFPNSKRGYVPWGNLVFDNSGNLYGSTIYGGTKGTNCDKFYGGQCGVVFELSPPKNKGGKWTEKVLHSFAGGTLGKRSGDSAHPNGGLALVSKGGVVSVYGTAPNGGNEIGVCQVGTEGFIGCGTVFELVPPHNKMGHWTETVLYQFTGKNDGAGPNGNLNFDAKARLYGTAGGGIGQSGVVFRLADVGGQWKESVLYSFTGRDDGSNPGTGLLFDQAGAVYGTALGGQTNRGLVFRLSPPKRGTEWSLRVVHNFRGPLDGNHPGQPLVFGRMNTLYGATVWGGGGSACQGGCGTIFEISR